MVFDSVVLLVGDPLDKPSTTGSGLIELDLVGSILKELVRVIGLDVEPVSSSTDGHDVPLLGVTSISSELGINLILMGEVFPNQGLRNQIHDSVGAVLQDEIL